MTNIQLRARLITDNPFERHHLKSSEVLKNIDTSFAFDLQAEAPTVFQFCLDEIAEQSADAFIVINVFHIDKAKRKLCLGESVIQVQQNNYFIFTCFKFRFSVEEKSFTTRIAKNQYS